MQIDESLIANSVGDALEWDSVNKLINVKVDGSTIQIDATNNWLEATGELPLLSIGGTTVIDASRNLVGLNLIKQDLISDKTGTADSTTTTYDSYGITLRGSYWDSANEVAKDYDALIKHVMIDNSPTSKLSIQFGGAEKAYIDNSGNLLILGNIIFNTANSMIEVKQGFTLRLDKDYEGTFKFSITRSDLTEMHWFDEGGKAYHAGNIQIGNNGIEDSSGNVRIKLGDPTYIKADLVMQPYHIWLKSLDADDTNTARWSPNLYFRGAYWDGSQSVEKYIRQVLVVNSDGWNALKWLDQDGNVLMQLVGNGNGHLWTKGNFYPLSDASQDLGSSSYRWRNGYFSGELIVGEKIRTNYPTSDDITIKAPRYGFFVGGDNVHLCYNAYWDGSNWNRIDTAKEAYIIHTGSAVDKVLRVRYAPAGDNPISWTELMYVNESGNLWLAGDLEIKNKISFTNLVAGNDSGLVGSGEGCYIVFPSYTKDTTTYDRIELYRQENCVGFHNRTDGFWIVKFYENGDLQIGGDNILDSGGNTRITLGDPVIVYQTIRPSSDGGAKLGVWSTYRWFSVNTVRVKTIHINPDIDQDLHIFYNSPNSPNRVMYLGRKASDSTNTVRNSAILAFRGSYWNGSESVYYNITLQNVMIDNTPTSKLSIKFNGTEKAYIDNSGNTWIAGDLEIEGNDILDSDGNTRITLGSTVTINGDLKVAGMLRAESGYRPSWIGDTVDYFGVYSDKNQADQWVQLRLYGKNSAGEYVIYAGLTSKILDATDGSEDSQVHISFASAGAFRSAIIIDPSDVDNTSSCDGSVSVRKLYYDYLVSSSSRRWKEVTGDARIDVLARTFDNIKLRLFRRRRETGELEREEVGIVAEELPDEDFLVQKNEKGEVEGIDLMGLISVIIAKIKKLDERISIIERAIRGVAE